MSQYILGLDLGPNSIGWAMLECDGKTGEPVCFFDSEPLGHPPMGVRVFEAGLHNFDTAKEASLNQSRRTARSMRRNHARRNARRRQMRSLLTEANLLPTDQNELEEIFRTNPYQLRAKGTSEDLEPFEVGRIMLHLCQRRGFKSNRKSGKAKEDQGLLQEIGLLETEIKKSGFQTLGQYLNHLANQSSPIDQVRLRNRHTRRDMFELEFDAIISRQKVVHSGTLTDDLIKKLHDTIFFQHPFEISEERLAKAPARANMHRAPSVRPCPLESDQMCGPKGDWSAQQFRILKETANFRISEHHGQERDLRPEEKQIILDILSSKDRIKFDAIRKSLAQIGVDPEARFNLERGDRKTLLGNSVEHRLTTSFGKKAWREMSPDVQINLRNLLAHAEESTELTAALIEAGLSQEKAAKLESWTPGDGYLGYSLTAVAKLLPFMIEGLDEYEAIQKAYPDRQEFGVVEKLPPLSSSELPSELSNITNPIVRRALVEVRKVINALIREHGLPRRIVVELAREMKSGSERRKEYNKRIRQRENTRLEAAIEVEKFGGNPHRRDDINRWLYWKEQEGLCLYTGKPIPASELFHGGEWEVDHILPRWRSLDDSMMNKVLVHRVANAEKKDRTPAEWLGPDSEPFKQLMRRASAGLNSGNLPYPKFKKLGTRELNTDDFAQRQLNDTRYLSKMVAFYLALLFPPEMRKGEKAIQTCKGGLTAELRRQWGLNSILPPLYNADGKEVLSEKTDSEGIPLKSRDDHRHHAIDAVVIAMSSRSFLKQYQDYWKKRDSLQSPTTPYFPQPWSGFRDDVKDQATRINVSHRVMRKISGAFHEETFYGPARDHEGAILVDRFVTRKNLPGLTGKMVHNIRDEAIRKVVIDRLKGSGWDGQSNSLPKEWHTQPLTMPSGMPIRKVRIEVPIKNAAQIKHRYAILGNNHHMEIVASHTKEKSGTPDKMWALVVPTLEAAKRVRMKGQGVVETDHGEDSALVMSLARKESVKVTNPGTGERIICVVQNMSGDSSPSTNFDLYLRDARDSRPASEGNKSPFKRLKSFRPWNELDIQKIQVDPLGRTSPAND